MNNHILELWAQMEAQRTMGIVKRLYDSHIPYHIFATYASDEHGYGVAFSYPEEIRIDTTPFSNLKKLKVGIYNDATLVNSKMLLIQLLASAQRDTFSCLCESLINTVKNMDSEEEMIKSVINQLDKWRNLFDKAGSEGLSPSQQQGLYGELTFLRKLITKNIFPASEALDYWVGVDAAQRDFMGDSWAVEVKTTATSNPKRLPSTAKGSWMRACSRTCIYTTAPSRLPRRTVKLFPIRYTSCAVTWRMTLRLYPNSMNGLSLPAILMKMKRCMLSARTKFAENPSFA